MSPVPQLSKHFVVDSFDELYVPIDSLNIQYSEWYDMIFVADSVRALTTVRRLHFEIWLIKSSDKVEQLPL